MADQKGTIFAVGGCNLSCVGGGGRGKKWQMTVNVEATERSSMANQKLSRRWRHKMVMFKSQPLNFFSCHVASFESRNGDHHFSHKCRGSRFLNLIIMEEQCMPQNKINICAFVPVGFDGPGRLPY
ncbi:hypothetical protein VNO77_06482 [Canavalia gladiata]|uniref:Uncharacterized protein n=1 Tax=Canavalia gladiata TaxID=3824 RepID=A0AAN9MCD2_CANGL